MAQDEDPFSVFLVSVFVSVAEYQSRLLVGGDGSGRLFLCLFSVSVSDVEHRSRLLGLRRWLRTRALFLFFLVSVFVSVAEYRSCLLVGGDGSGRDRRVGQGRAIRRI